MANADRIAELTRGAERAGLAALQLAHDADQDRLADLLADNVRRALGNWCAAAAQRTDRWEAAAEALLALFDPARSAQLSSSLLGSFDQAREVIDTLAGDPRGPEEWRAYRDGLAVLARHGADDLVAAAAERGLDLRRLPDVVEQALLRAWADGVLTSDDRLRTTRADDLDARVADFQEADRRLIAAAGRAVIEACNTRRHRRFGSGGGAVITRESEKKTRHMPVRDLFDRTREVVQAIKPCFMMSPLTVSQMLPADFQFDVVIFDEASQVRPGDAINSVYRGRTLVVAGDEKQLPPTSFFDATVEDDSDEYAEDVPDSFESLLHACKAEFVAQRVLHHFGTRPGLTLGVVALSQAQASAIDLAVLQVRLSRPDLEHCLTEDRLDGFFVKSLESVQGDERDVMIMSVGYDPDEHGKLGLNFGPINKPGGWRRLNVTVTRARNRMEVVASFRGGSLPDCPTARLPERERPPPEAVPGVRGERPVGTVPGARPSDAEPDSPFEGSVLKVLHGWGYEVQPQVGVAGYRIDLGLRHPALPGAYALGIECDGAMYHSSKAARDRDREQVLNGLGWRLYRIWGTDWYRGRGREAAELRLREAVEHAIAQGPLTRAAPVTLPRQASPVDEPVVGPEPVRVGRAIADDGGRTLTVTPAPPAPPAQLDVKYERVPVDTQVQREWSAPYETKWISAASPHEIHTPEAKPALRIAPAERTLALWEPAAECPGMSDEELMKQACEFFGWTRLGPDIRATLTADIEELQRLHLLAGAPDRITAVG
ncbi:AAA domain-containing protein [Streptomyces sp. SBC-4]|nr:AAA domain-containing protein [Streptomyces sp. SBC-4]MDV5148979.1 AAA domain-containing protein [Streptomyces sp. SBC-4]